MPFDGCFHVQDSVIMQKKWLLSDWAPKYALYKNSYFNMFALSDHADLNQLQGTQIRSQVKAGATLDELYLEHKRWISFLSTFYLT